MLLEDMLGELGYAVAAQAGTHRRGAGGGQDRRIRRRHPRRQSQRQADLARWPRRWPRAARRSSSPPATASAACPSPFATARSEEAVPDRRPQAHAASAWRWPTERLASAARPSTSLSCANSSASLVMNGSSVMSRRSGVTVMRLSASAEMSVPSRRRLRRACAHRRSSSRRCRGRRGAARCAAAPGGCGPAPAPRCPSPRSARNSGKLTLTSTSRGMPAVEQRGG